MNLPFNRGKKAYVGIDSGMFTRPSVNRLAIVRALLEGSSPYWFLVNLTTKVGLQIPVNERIWGAAFSTDGRWIYVATDMGIKQINVDNLNDIRLIDDTIAGLGMTFASFSFDTKYILLAGSDKFSTPLIYQLFD